MNGLNSVSYRGQSRSSVCWFCFSIYFIHLFLITNLEIFETLLHEGFVELDLNFSQVLGTTFWCFLSIYCSDDIHFVLRHVACFTTH